MSTNNNESREIILINSDNKQPTSPTTNVILKDQSTKQLYTLYVSNNKLTMEVV